MFFHFRDKFPQLNAYWEKYQPFLTYQEVPARTILLEEGKRSQHYVFIEKGCVRSYFMKNGEEKTAHFFFEQEGFTAIDSFINNTPSQFTIETIEPSAIYLMEKEHVITLLDELSTLPGFVHLALQMFSLRQTHYMNEIVSFIRDTPE